MAQSWLKVGCLGLKIYPCLTISGYVCNKYPLQRDIFCLEASLYVWPFGPCVELCSICVWELCSKWWPFGPWLEKLGPSLRKKDWLIWRSWLVPNCYIVSSLLLACLRTLVASLPRSLSLRYASLMLFYYSALLKHRCAYSCLVFARSSFASLMYRYYSVLRTAHMLFATLIPCLLAQLRFAYWVYITVRSAHMSCYTLHVRSIAALILCIGRASHSVFATLILIDALVTLVALISIRYLSLSLLSCTLVPCTLAALIVHVLSCTRLTRARNECASAIACHEWSKAPSCVWSKAPCE
jgi:hypothetical protein